MTIVSRECNHPGCSRLTFSQDSCGRHDGKHTVYNKKTNKSSRKKTKSSIDPNEQIISKSKDGTKERVYRKCSSTGCDNIAKKWGVCYKHGAPRSLGSCKGVNENEEKDLAKDTTAENDSDLEVGGEDNLFCYWDVFDW
jgi:hypothetical protein